MDGSMRALRARARGGPETLAVETVPVPSPAADEVLLAVHAAGITYAELVWDETWAHLPTIPAHEVSGVVVEVGDQVEGFAPGDTVYGLIRFERQGAAAEYVTVPAADLARKPGSLSHVEAAAVPLSALTAWQGLFDVVHLNSAERVLVLGGAGGVGTFAVQLAAHVGARVTATARGAGVALAQRLGADRVIDTDREDFTDGAPRFDVVFDTVGGDALEKSFDVLEPGGRLVTLQAPPDQHRAARAQVDASFFIVSPDVQELDALSEMADRRLLEVVIGQTFALEDGRAAFETGQSPARRPGKTVLVIRS